DQNVLGRRPQWDKHGCHSRREAQASLEGSFRGMRSLDARREGQSRPLPLVIDMVRKLNWTCVVGGMRGYGVVKALSVLVHRARSEGREGSGQTILLARRAPTIKR